jgi:hypothetical protein
MTARGAQLPWLSLFGTHLPALVADQLQVDGSLELDQLHVNAHGKDGAVRLCGACIDGNLSCSGAQLENKAGPALNAVGLQVGGTASLGSGFRATGHGEGGAVRLRGAHISGRLDCSNAQLYNQTGPALHATRLQADSTVLLNKLTATGHGEDGAALLRGARIGGRLFCRDARLHNETGPALQAARLQVDGSVHFEGLRATGHDEDGAVRLFGARIGGHLVCRGAQLDNDAGPALDAEAMQVTGTAFLRDGFHATGHGKNGAVRLRGAHIGGRLYCQGALLHNQTGPALQAARLQVNDSVHFEELRAIGHGDQGTLKGFAHSSDISPGVLAAWPDETNRLPP